MNIINQLYVYCTDFVINMANILNLSYYEINFLLFILLYPALLLGSTTFYITYKLKLRKLLNGDKNN